MVRNIEDIDINCEVKQKCLIVRWNENGSHRIFIEMCLKFGRTRCHQEDTSKSETTENKDGKQTEYRTVEVSQKHDHPA